MSEMVVNAEIEGEVFLLWAVATMSRQSLVIKVRQLVKYKIAELIVVTLH